MSVCLPVCLSVCLPERDLKNYPLPERPMEAGKVRMGMIPEEVFEVLNMHHFVHCVSVCVSVCLCLSVCLPERDMKNYPLPERPMEAGKVRMGMIPEEVFEVLNTHHFIQCLSLSVCLSICQREI